MTEKARHKIFKSKPQVVTPVTFELDGEKFTALPAIPGAKLLDFIRDADSGDGGRAAQALVDFLQDVIVEEDRDRFAELIRDERRPIEIALIAEICEWLVGEYAVRPTEAPKPSPAGRSRSGRGSTVTASSQE